VVDNLNEHDERNHRWALTGAEGELIRTVIKEVKGG
jgi:hypothetical protein